MIRLRIYKMNFFSTPAILLPRRDELSASQPRSAPDEPGKDIPLEYMAYLRGKIDDLVAKQYSANLAFIDERRLVVKIMYDFSNDIQNLPEAKTLEPELKKFRMMLCKQAIDWINNYIGTHVIAKKLKNDFICYLARDGNVSPELSQNTQDINQSIKALNPSIFFSICAQLDAAHCHGVRPQETKSHANKRKTSDSHSDSDEQTEIENSDSTFTKESSNGKKQLLESSLRKRSSSDLSNVLTPPAPSEKTDTDTDSESDSNKPDRQPTQKSSIQLPDPPTLRRSPRGHFPS